MFYVLCWPCGVINDTTNKNTPLQKFAGENDENLGRPREVWSTSVASTWKDLTKVHRSVRMPSPRLSSLTSRITRNRRKKLILMIVELSSCGTQTEQQWWIFQASSRKPRFIGTVTMTTVSSKHGAITLPRMNVSGYVGHVTIFSWIMNAHYCVLFSSRVAVRVRSRLSITSASGYARERRIKVFQYRDTYRHFGVDDVGDAAENYDEIKHVPRITEIVLRQPHASLSVTIITSEWDNFWHKSTKKNDPQHKQYTNWSWKADASFITVHLVDI